MRESRTEGVRESRLRERERRVKKRENENGREREGGLSRLGWCAQSLADGQGDGLSIGAGEGEGQKLERERVIKRKWERVEEMEKGDGGWW